jgi:hypothetical protein
MSDTATDAAKPAPAQEQAAIIIAAAVVVLGGRRRGLSSCSGARRRARPSEAVEHAEDTRLPAQFVALDPPFVVNFEAGASARFLQVAVQLMTRDPAMVELLKSPRPDHPQRPAAAVRQQTVAGGLHARGQGGAAPGRARGDPRHHHRQGGKPESARSGVLHQLRDAVNAEPRMNTRRADRTAARTLVEADAITTARTART